jgi:hypothetical protein
MCEMRSRCRYEKRAFRRARTFASNNDRRLNRKTYEGSPAELSWGAVTCS